MPNKISGYKATEPLAPIKGQGAHGQVADKSQTAGSSAAAPAQASADHLTLTGPALALQKLGAAVAAAPVVNAAKVAAVKQSVQNGTYQINSGRVADKLVAFESGLKK